MDARSATRCGIEMADFICQGYLGDLTDGDLLQRPVPGTNHIAWQLGHLIQSDNQMVNDVCPGSMPALPAGFKEQHSKEQAANDNPQDFLTKAEYLKIAAEQRAAVFATLAKQSDSDLDKPSPESMQGYAPTVGSVFVMVGSHWMMHSGQWAVLRRKLGRPPLF